MRIAIIAHPLHAGGGISVARNLIASIGKTAPEHDYFVSFPSGLGYEEAVVSLPNLKTSAFLGRSNLIKRFWYEQNQLKPALRRFEPDLILALANKGMGGFDCPQAILCHNSYLWYPRKHYGVRTPAQTALTLLQIQLQRFFLWWRLRKPENILLYQTEIGRKRIFASYKAKSQSIHCPNAVSKFVAKPEANPEKPSWLSKYSGRFKLFYLTRYYPHKNLEVLVEAFHRHAEVLTNTVVFITIDANQHPGARKLLNSIEQHGLQDQIVNVGPLPQNELGIWFKSCDALIMPTLLESFSGTYLEAMHFGLPILTSDLDFAREVCGDAALYFDPWDTSSIKDAILKIRNDPELADNLRAKGKARLDEMQRSWDEIATELLQELYILSNINNK
ncbi:MAG: glycosyltransferase family 4 protein [Verrucomicrobia bacterium]|nr:glycosyltransferase family 4 protein [Verrucomicrobiota bacterium]